MSTFPVIVCIAKLESDYIEEFVKYHLALGFKRIYIYDNEDEPIYENLLKAYNEHIHVIHYPGNNYDKGIQYIVLEHFIDKFLHKQEITHVAHIDIDEFIVLKKHNNICEFIEEYIVGDCEGIGMNWRFFGSSGNLDKTNLPATLRFTMCEEKGNKHIKTLFKKDNFLNYNSCHDVSLQSGYIKSTNGAIIRGPFNDNIDFSVIQLNHYKCKTLPEFRKIRTRQRADVSGKIEENVDENFHLYNKNEVEELTARNFYKTRVVQTFSQDSSNVERSSDISIFEKTIDVAIAAAPSLNIDYKSQKTILCDIGKKYDTDKSSQRENVTDYRHCHPYTLFYDSLFTSKKNENVTIAELGILNGSSLRMWQEYFPNAKIYGFENNYDLISDFKNNYNNERIALHYVDVKIKTSIELAFSNINQMYDIIIEDTTHEFEDQIRTIESVYSYLKPGGVLIIEDIFKRYNEKDYIERLSPILKHFQSYYFVSLEHKNRVSTGWDNDKLFVLIKNGAPPIFRNERKLTIITPSFRLQNLPAIKNSINFDYVNEWIIVYDGNKINDMPNLFTENEKIKEYLHKSDGKVGNAQRNYALSKISNQNTYVYYLDDDNLIHPMFYKLLDIIDENKIYTFNQESGIKGNNIDINHIDTAMFLIDYNLCKDVTWNVDIYNADGYYIKECYEKNSDKHIFIDNDLCFYNKIAEN